MVWAAGWSFETVLPFLCTSCLDCLAGSQAHTPLLTLFLGRSFSCDGALGEFVGDDTGENDDADDGELGALESGEDEVHHVAEDAEERCADDDADDGSAAAAQAATSEDGCGDGVEFVEVAVINGLGLVEVEDEEESGQPGQTGTNDVGQGDHLVGVDSAEARSFFVVAEREEVAAVDGSVEEDADRDGDNDEDDAGDGKAKAGEEGDLARGQPTQAFVIGSETGGLVAGESAGDAAINQQTAEGDDEGLQLEFGDEQSVGQADEEWNGEGNNER